MDFTGWTGDYTNGNLAFGTRGTLELRGQLDVPMIFNRALSAGEVALLYREPFCMFARTPIELWAAATQGVIGGELILLSALVSASSSASSGLLRLLQLASTFQQGVVDWVGVDSSHILAGGAGTAFCGEDGIYTLEAGLNGARTWDHDVDETHWFIIDLGVSYNIQKVRGRSDKLRDPIDVNIYVSDDTENWGAAVATGISIWQDTTSWVEIDVVDQIGRNTTPKNGRYVKVEIIDTENVSKELSFGNNFTIFDVYGGIFISQNLGQSSATGSLTIKDKVLLAAVVAASSSVSGGLLKLAQFAAAVSATCSTSADFTARALVDLAAAISASCSASAGIHINSVLSASAAGTISTDAALKTLVQIAAEVATQSSTSVSFDILKNMAAVIIAESSVEAAIYILRPLAAAVAAESNVSARMIIAGVASGVDEAVRNEFQFPHIPDTVPEDVKKILVELRMMLEQQLIGDFRIGGALDIDGDIHARGILK